MYNSKTIGGLIGPIVKDFLPVELSPVLFVSGVVELFDSDMFFKRECHSKWVRKVSDKFISMYPINV